jgi:hypothetical protein
MFVILWHCLCSFVNSSIWSGNQRWVWSGGSWCFRYFKCSSWLNGVLTRCHKCFQCHLSRSHFLGTLHSKKPFISTFFCSIHLCSIGFLFFQPPFSFGRIIYQPLFGGHTPTPWWHVCWAYFCANPLSSITLFYMVFFLLYFHFFYW